MTPKEIIKELKKIINYFRSKYGETYPLALRYAIQYIEEKEREEK